MGYTVTYKDVYIWGPSVEVGRYFLDSTERLERLVRSESGIHSNLPDEIDIDGESLTTFIDAILHLFETSNNTPLLAMVSGISEVLLAIEAKIPRNPPRKGTARTGALIERAKLVFESSETHLG